MEPAPTISAITFMRELPPIFTDLKDKGESASCSNSNTFWNALDRFFSINNSHAGILDEKSNPSEKESTKPRSTACFGPSLTGMQSSFSSPGKSPDARPGISIRSYFLGGRERLSKAGVVNAATSIFRTRTSAPPLTEAFTVLAASFPVTTSTFFFFIYPLTRYFKIINIPYPISNKTDCYGPKEKTHKPCHHKHACHSCDLSEII